MTSANLLRTAFPTNSVLRAGTIKKLKGSTKIYLIFIVARSGSTWLTELASKGGRLGVPQEWFNEAWIHTDVEALGCKPPRVLGTTDVSEYLQTIVEQYRSKEGAFGIEFSGVQSKMFLELLEDARELLCDSPVFYLRRKNLVRQAISLYRSADSGFYHSYQTDTKLRKHFDKVEYNANAIELSMQGLLADEAYFEDLFERYGIAARRFYYEDLIKNPKRVLRQMCFDVFGRSFFWFRFPDMSDGVMKPISDQKNDIWETRFRSEWSTRIAEIECLRPPLSV